MKPYFLVACNFIRFSLKHLINGRRFCAAPIQITSINTKIVLSPRGQINLGSNTVSDGRTVIMAGNDAILTIGSHVYFNEGTMISCKESIHIGDGCRFGPNVKVFDNDHKFNACLGVSAEHSTAPITIGRNCWLGANVIILRGSHIGDNCVIGAGCIVKGKIPTGSLVTQNRELIIRPIEDSLT